MAVNNTFGTPDNSVGNLNGMFKDTYESKLKNLIPEGLKLMKDIKFLQKSKQPGNIFNSPVILGAEHGVTFGSSDDDAFNLNPAIAGAIKNAEVRGNPIVMRSRIGYTALSRAAQGDQAAFEDATKYVVANMLRSLSKKLEIEMLYGQVGYATTSGAVTTVVTIDTAAWAPGIWSGAEGMPIEIRDTTGATSRGVFTVASVDMEARTLTMTTNAAAAGVVNTDVLWHMGAYGNEFAGIHKIITNTGTLFNISAAQYNLWKGNSYSASSGALSFTKLIKAAARAYEKGSEGKVLALVNPRGWTDLMSDQAALRKYDASYSSESMKNGTRSLTFFSQSGEITIEVSNYVKEGFAYLLALQDWVRVGSSDVSFRRPGAGAGADQFFFDIGDAAGLEIRAWSDQCVFTSRPGANTLITAIVNSA